MKKNFCGIIWDYDWQRGNPHRKSHIENMIYLTSIFPEDISQTFKKRRG